MSGARKCKNCGSSEIEVDPGRGDAVCTVCGSVLEDNIIVAEVQFEEGANGTANTIGQFVSSDSKGGGTSFGNGNYKDDTNISNDLIVNIMISSLSCISWYIGCCRIKGVDIEKST